MKKFLLSNASKKSADVIEVGDVLVREKGKVKIISEKPARARVKIYEVRQNPFGDSYLISENEKLCLMLMIGPESRRDGPATLVVEGCTETDHQILHFYEKDLADRTARDFLQPGSKIEILVKDYIKRPEKWKRCFGGYFLPISFKNERQCPFDPKDVVYLAPSSISSKYIESPAESRLEVFQTYVDRYGKPIGDNVLFTTSTKILEIIKKLGKSLGYLPMKVTENELVLRNVFSSWELPSNVYPITVKYYGEMDYYETPGTDKILLEDGTVAFW